MRGFAFSDVLEPAGDTPVVVRARISVRRADDGGRKTSFGGAYRPNHNFGGVDNRIFFIGEVQIPDGVRIQPGETHDLLIRFLNVRGISELLQVGRSWRIQEGPVQVATAEVLERLT